MKISESAAKAAATTIVTKLLYNLHFDADYANYVAERMERADKKAPSDEELWRIYVGMGIVVPLVEAGFNALRKVIVQEGVEDEKDTDII